ncbi:MAG: cupin domain-containing protein [Burkholderiales bacterium]|nr:cupin domain-containing protein [Burkholderiales bacterium]
MPMTSAQTCIEQLALQPHPEGGYYRETYRSAHTLPVLQPADATPALRNVCTGIYFLLEAGNFSAFHQIASDEMWHFYAGQAIEVLQIDTVGTLTCTRLGPDLLNGDVPQHVVPARTWFASRVAQGGAFALVGCTVAPGFDFADFELAKRHALCNQYPQHRALIAGLTRD